MAAEKKAEKMRKSEQDKEANKKRRADLAKRAQDGVDSENHRALFETAPGESRSF